MPLLKTIFDIGATLLNKSTIDERARQARIKSFVTEGKDYIIIPIPGGAKRIEKGSDDWLDYINGKKFDS